MGPKSGPSSGAASSTASRASASTMARSSVWFRPSSSAAVEVPVTWSAIAILPRGLRSLESPCPSRVPTPRYAKSSIPVNGSATPEPYVCETIRAIGITRPVCSG